MLGWEFDSFSLKDNRKVGEKFLWKYIYSLHRPVVFGSVVLSSIIHITWELVRSADYLSPPQTTESETGGVWPNSLVEQLLQVILMHTLIWEPQGQIKISLLWVQKSKKFNYNLCLNPTRNMFLHVPIWWFFLWKAEWFLFLHVFYYHVTFLTRPFISSLQDILLHASGWPLAYLGS